MNNNIIIEDVFTQLLLNNTYDSDIPVALSSTTKKFRTILLTLLADEYLIPYDFVYMVE